MAVFIGLWALGLVVGACGTLVGAGGGFILMPLLLLIYPGDSPERLTAISLAVIFCNAASGSLAYARMKRIDYRSALLFSAAGIPGALIGALSTDLIPRRVFEAVFGLLMLAGAALLLARPGPRRGQAEPAPLPAGALSPPYNRPLGIGISLGVGYVSSLLGIGGGVIHVPIMAQVLCFPVHVATATSQVVLCVLALAGSLTHLLKGNLAASADRLVPLALGVTLGAQAGAALSRRIHGNWIIRILGVALASVGVRILVGLVRNGQ